MNTTDKNILMGLGIISILLLIFWGTFQEGITAVLWLWGLNFAFLALGGLSSGTEKDKRFKTGYKNNVVPQDSFIKRLVKTICFLFLAVILLSLAYDRGNTTQTIDENFDVEMNKDSLNANFKK